jgi:phosphoesterase RecJ-like protein
VFVSKDKNSLYRVNIRSRGPEINEIAAKHGGGGHKFASGVRTDSHEVVEALLKELSECARIYKEEKDGNN